MNFTLEKLKEARDAGIPDDVIWEVASETEPKFLELKQNNIPIDIAIEVFQGGESEPEPSGVLRQAADIPIQFAKGTLQGTRMFTDLLGAGNPISKQIAGGEDYLDALLSAESKKDSEESARILKAAEDKGVYDQVVAGLEALSKAPLETAFNVAGMAVPNLALGALGKAAQAGKAAITATQVGLGALQGAGSIKGQIYQAVQDELRSQGMDEETIHKTASEAQAYGGKNLDQILLGAGLGAAATRAEVILSRVISGAGKEVTDDVIKNTFKNGLFEAIPETFQGGQEQIAQNKALQNIGVDVPTMRGVVSASTMEGVAGGAFGGVAGLTESMSATPQSISTKRNASPEAKAEAEIDRDSDIQAAKLSIPANDTNKNLILDRVQQARQGIVNLQESLDVLEPTDPKAQGLRLDISAKQKELASLEAMAGLSKPITTIEEQQAALAKAITTPEAAPAKPKPLPTDVLPTETPGATYGREEQVYDVFGGITRKPVSKPAELPAAPTIEEQTAEGTYGGQTGVFDVFGGTRRKPVVTEEPPVSMVGKEVIPGVTPVPAPTKPTVNQSLTVAPEAPAITKDIFARLVTNQEKKNEKAKSKGYDTIPDKVGYDVVFKPYGEQGAGYYYTPSKQIETAKKTPEELSKKEQSDLDWAKGTIAAAEQGVTPAIASLEQAKRIVQKLEPAQEAPAVTPAPVAETPAVTEAVTPAPTPAATKIISPAKSRKSLEGAAAPSTFSLNDEEVIALAKIVAGKTKQDIYTKETLDAIRPFLNSISKEDAKFASSLPIKYIPNKVREIILAAPATSTPAVIEAPSAEVAPIAGDIQVANEPKAQQTISATSEAISKKEPLPQTRGGGTQYHGARGPIENLVEAYYSPDNIYGGEGTFYTTDALDIAAGYQRKKQSGVIYRVNEVAPVNFFNMEERKPKTEWLSMFEGQGDFFEFAVEGINNDTPNLREIMDEMRAESSNEGLSKDDVQEIFGSITYNLQKQGYGGMTHIGGLKTNREPHGVKIYFDPTNQISLSLEDVTNPSQKPTTPTTAVSETITEPAIEPESKISKIKREWVDYLAESKNKKQRSDRVGIIWNSKSSLDPDERAAAQQFFDENLHLTKEEKKQEAEVTDPAKPKVKAKQKIKPQAPVLDPIGYGNALIDLFPTLKSTGVKAISMEESLARLEREWEKKQKSGKATRLDQLVYLANKKNTEDALAGDSVGGTWSRSYLTVAVSSKATPSAMAHEIGHAIMELEFTNADQKTKDEIIAEYNKWYALKYGKNGVPSVADQRRIWEWMSESDWLDPKAPFPQEKRVEYWEQYRSSFDEWFADEVAKWAATREKPKSLVDKFFTEIAAKLKKLWNAISENFAPNETLATWLDSITEVSPSKIPKQPERIVSETITPAAESISVGNRIKLGKSPQTYIVEEVVPQSEVEKANNEQYYSVRNEKTGEAQVVEKADMKRVKKSADTRKTVVGDTQYQTEGVIPEDQRFTEDELRVIVNDIFGGKIPDKIKIITDATDPNKEFKAAYSISKGTITYNLAYLAKGDDLSFVTNHELGHFILGDPKFQVEMARLFDTLPTDIQEKLKKAIDEAYAQEGMGVRAEETIVFAFGEILENAPDGRNILQRFLDAIRDAINRLFKTEGYIPRNPKKAAAAILMAARNKFERGEFIRRPNGSILMMTPTSPKDLMRDADYLAAVERGDMETAQRMVDEKLANIGAFWHGTPSGDLRGGKTGLHVGTKQAAMEALEARIGIPADGKGWNGDKEYSKTLLAGKDRIKANEFGKYRLTGYNVDAPNEDYYPTKMPTVGNNVPIDPTWKPWLRPILIVGEMTNTQRSPISDAAANRKIQRKKGAFYTNEGEDAGSVSAVLPNGDSVRVKLADPVTYDDAGNVIPLSQRFQPSEPDIRRMAVKRGQVASIKNAGAEKKTPKQIIARTRELLRKDFFNPAEVTEENTLTAFRALGKLVGPKKEAAAYAEELNDIGRLVDEEGVASEVSMGAILFTNDLFEYSIKLAAEGQKMMLGIMMSNMNKLPLGEGITLEEGARAMRGALERSTNFTMMGKAEQDAFANYVAEFIYGPNPTKEQIQSIKDAYAAVEKTPQVTEQELTDEIAAVGGRTGTDLVGKINEEFTKATDKGKEKRKTEEAELDEEYSKVQKQADAEIEKLAKIQSDTPSFDPAAARQITNDVRAIVANDLKQRPDMGRKAPWKSMLVAKLQEAGVELTAAETLADIVWRQHEINSLSRELSSINKAIEKGPISEIVKAIKETPLEDQQKPNWRYEVMRDYLRRAGLSLAQAERIAKLMDISLQKRFTMAQEQAFTDAISKTAPWKSGDTRSRRAFQKVLQALRAGALDPARNVLSDMAALNGWTGFTPEQYKDLLKYDAILADPKTSKADLAEAHKAIQNIISKAKLPIRARDVIGQYYDAQALSGITTMTVNIFSPAGVAARNALVQSLNGLVTARPEQITAAMTTFVDSIKSWANTVAYSFKNNVTVYSNVEYLVNDEGLLKLYNRGVDQFNNGKTPRERADGVKNMMIGMMDYVRRVLNALDYGAIASLQNQAVSKYALAVMQAKGMSSADGTKMLNAMMEQKRIFYTQQIAIGTDKNKAAVLADEFFISAWEDALTKEGVEKSEIKKAMDAALNDALSAVGRNRQSLDAFMEEETNIRDEGLLSFPAIWLLETMANAANKQDNQFIKIFSRIIYGFAIVPARVLREAAWFSPLAAHRFAYDYIAKKKGLKSRYAQSLGNDLQYRQRLTETIAGSIVMLAFGAAMSASTDDEEDKKPFKIVVTGNGPLRNEDPQFYDSWVKKNRPNTVSVYFGKTKFTLNTMRGFEAFAWPAMMLGAVDDWHIRRKQGRTTNTPLQMQDAAIVAGNVLSASLRRGPYAFAAKPLFEAYGDRGVESLAKSLAFPAKTIVPVLGSSLASNISNFLNEPIDRRTLEGALWANVPFIGPTVAPKSLNAFGEPALANDAADKIFKLGVPIVFDIPTDRESIKLHELVLKQGGGPSIPTRNQLAQRLDREPTNKEYEMFVTEYGAVLTRVMKKNYDTLFNANTDKYSKLVDKLGLRARDIAENKVRQAAKKP